MARQSVGSAAEKGRPQRRGDRAGQRGGQATPKLPPEKMQTSVGLEGWLLFLRLPPKNKKMAFSPFTWEQRMRRAWQGHSSQRPAFPRALSLPASAQWVPGADSRCQVAQERGGWASGLERSGFKSRLQPPGGQPRASHFAAPPPFPRGEIFVLMYSSEHGGQRNGHLSCSVPRFPHL